MRRKVLYLLCISFLSFLSKSQKYNLSQGVNLGIWAGYFLKADYMCTSLGYRKMTYVSTMHANPIRHNFKFSALPYYAEVGYCKNTQVSEEFQWLD